MSLYKKRCERAQELMLENNIDYLIVGGGTDLKYISNYSHGQSERLGSFILSVDKKPCYLGPSFEMPRFEHSKLDVFFDLIPWEEWEDPVEIMKRVITKHKATIAVNDRHQFRFLVKYMNHFPNAKFVDAFPVLGEMRIHKDATEISYLKHLGKALDRAWEEALTLTYTGRKESELAQDLHDIKKKVFSISGAPIISLSSRAGRPLTGINTASAHGGGGDRVIERGDALYWECGGGSCMDYVGDKTRSGQVGVETGEYKKMYNIVKETQQTTFEAVKPGVTCESIDITARKVLAKYGVEKYMPHRVGHGLGMDGHEYPYLVKGNKRLLEPGMVFSVEPGLYFPGKWGIRIEDIVYVTEDGAESFYHSTKEYHVLA